MVILRGTKKVLALLPRSGGVTGESTNALGDWYVNRLVVDRRPLLILVSERSRLAILEPARDVKDFPGRLPELVRRRLIALGAPQSQIEREVDAMRDIEVGPTASRSIIGQMVDFASAVPYFLPKDEWGDGDLRLIEQQLGETPCLCSGRFRDTIWPAREALKLLGEMSS